VSVVTYGGLKKMMTGLRHILYFLELIYQSIGADYIIALDTFSVGLPAVACGIILGQKVVVRVGGDFVWESYVERTREEVLLSNFYTSHRRRFSLKEQIIFRLTGFVLRHSDMVVFSTAWQRDIMSGPYHLKTDHTRIIENFFPLSQPVEPVDSILSEQKVFLSPSRNIVIKNKKMLADVFLHICREHPEVSLDTHTVSQEVLLEKMSKAYAVVVNSFSEVSPNLVCDAISVCVPVIVTRDNGISDRLQDMVLYIDPFSSDDLSGRVRELLDPTIYEQYKQRMRDHTYTHTWNEIAQEFIDLY
jgi:glycosyltransferase involved in cell wall biosynthesis